MQLVLMSQQLEEDVPHTEERSETPHSSEERGSVLVSEGVHEDRDN